jgi:hypothetical protein
MWWNKAFGKLRESSQTFLHGRIEYRKSSYYILIAINHMRCLSISLWKFNGGPASMPIITSVER